MGWRVKPAWGLASADDGPDEQVDDGALAGAGAADDGDVQRRRGLAVEERADGVANESGGKAELIGVGELIFLTGTVFFEPARGRRKAAW